MAFFLKIIGTDGKKDFVQRLEQGETLVGRSRSAKVKVENADVSGKHFVVRLVGQTASIENLSTAGIIIDGRVLFERAPWIPGQEIQVGNDLKCILIEADEAEMVDLQPAAALTIAAGVGPDEPAAQSDAGRTDETPNLADVATGDSTTAVGTETGDETSNDSTGSKNTQVQKTRVATPEEILYIKHQRVAMRRRRVVSRVLIFLLLSGVLAWMWLQKSSPEERVLSWPKLADGKFSTKFTCLPDAGMANGAFNLYYPYWSNTLVKVSENNILINTFLGEMGSVPFNIFLERTLSREFLTIDLHTAMSQWMAEVSQGGDDSWSFEGIWPLSFYGNDNGIPYLTVAYTRSQNDIPWAGLAHLFRKADARYVLRLEVPLNEKSRAGYVLHSAQLLRFNPVYVSSHWEGGVKPSPCSWERIQAIQNALRQDSPGRLVDLELAIKGMLIQSRLDNDNVHFQLLMEQFQLLRLGQRKMYNLFKIKLTNAKIDEDKSRIAGLIQDSLAVFSLSDDKRYHDIRNGKW